LLGRCFTWSNNQENPILSHIDRIFCSTEFDEKFPLAIAKALPINPSDHVPILWEFGLGNALKKPRFKFENWWLQHDEFAYVVDKVSNSQVSRDTVVERWQNKVRKFRRKVRGWSANVEASLRRKKDRLSAEYARLDILMESRTLSSHKKEKMV
jgi:GTP-dependent phosphoenolpyruvate carboxykinase